LIFRTFLVGLLLTGGAFGLFEWELLHGEGIDKARTAAVTMFVIGQAFYLLNCRSLRDTLFTQGVFSNPAIFIGIGILLLFQICFIYLPPLQTLFTSAPLDARAWLYAITTGVIVLPIISLDKWIRNRRRG
jgi:Ca2+-transporting ATPase